MAWCCGGGGNKASAAAVANIELQVDELKERLQSLRDLFDVLDDKFIKNDIRIDDIAAEMTSVKEFTLTKTNELSQTVTKLRQDGLKQNRRSQEGDTQNEGQVVSQVEDAIRKEIETRIDPLILDFRVELKQDMEQLHDVHKKTLLQLNHSMTKGSMDARSRAQTMLSSSMSEAGSERRNASKELKVPAESRSASMTSAIASPNRSPFPSESRNPSPQKAVLKVPESPHPQSRSPELYPPAEQVGKDPDGLGSAFRGRSLRPAAPRGGANAI